MVLMSATVHAMNEAIPVAIYDGLNQEVSEQELNEKRLELESKFLSSLDENKRKQYQDCQLDVMLRIRK